MKKKIILLLTGVIIVSMLTSCSSTSNISIGSVEKNTSASMSMSYYKFNGQKSKSLLVKKGEVVDVNVDIVSKAGSIDFSIVNEDGESFYEGTDIPTSSFEVTLEKEGDYMLSVSAKNHKGSFKISWSEREQD